MRARNLRRKAGLTEYREHPVVLGKHLSDEARDAVVTRPVGQVRHQDRAEAAAAQRVGHLEGDLGTVGIDRLVGGVRHDVGRVARRCHEAEPIPAPRISSPTRGLGEVGTGREESQLARLQRHPSSNMSRPSPSASLTGRMQTVEPSLSTT